MCNARKTAFAACRTVGIYPSFYTYVSVVGEGYKFRKGIEAAAIALLSRKLIGIGKYIGIIKGIAVGTNVQYYRVEV